MARRKGYRRLNKPNRKHHKQRSISPPSTAQAHSKPDSQHGSEPANQPSSSPQTISNALAGYLGDAPAQGSGAGTSPRLAVLPSRTGLPFGTGIHGHTLILTFPVRLT